MTKSMEHTLVACNRIVEIHNCEVWQWRTVILRDGHVCYHEAKTRSSENSPEQAEKRFDCVDRPHHVDLLSW